MKVYADLASGPPMMGGPNTNVPGQPTPAQRQRGVTKPIYTEPPSEKTMLKPGLFKGNRGTMNG